MQEELTFGHGLCECGCGEKTTVAGWHMVDGVWIKEWRPKRFIQGHNARKRTPMYEVRDCGYKTSCWVWLWTINPGGYGQINRDRKTIAHRWMYERLIGPIPEGKHLDHLCGVRACVNPEHLEPVTMTENARRGKQSKLTYETAAEVRELKRAGWKAKDIAEAYGISQGRVFALARGEGWHKTED